MRKNKKKSRISEADKELARRGAIICLSKIALGLEIDYENLCSAAIKLGAAYPTDEITIDNRRPPEHRVVVNVAGCILEAIRCIKSLLNK